jgi:OFA family oxalate/formate antiporter-like MFS transporter
MTSQNSSSSSRGWIVVLAALAINLILGVLYAWGVVAKALKTDPQWHWTTTQASMPFTVATAAFAITMIFAGRLQDKVGPRFVAMFGGIILGLGMVASSFTTTPDMMVLTFGVIGGIGIGVGYSATTPPAIKWFPPARKGLITGIVVSGVGLAAVYISPLTETLLAKRGIPNTFLILGLGTIVLVVVLAQLITNPPAGYSPAPAPAAGSSPAKAAAARPNLDWHEMLGTPQFWQLWIMFILAASAGLMMISQVPIIAKQQANLKWGFVTVATLAIFNTCGRILAGYLSDRIGRSRTMVLAFVLQSINMFCFAQYTTPNLVIFGSAFTGLCYGTIFTLFPATTADFYGIRNLGVNYGIMFTGFGVAGVLGPIAAANINDRYHSYSYAYLASAILLLVGAALAMFLKAPTFQPAQTTPPSGPGAEQQKPAPVGAAK